MSVDTFSDLLASASHENGEMRVTVNEYWMQGRTTYGGLTAALSLEAVRASASDLPPLRSANVAFIGPAGGPVTARPRELRRGRSVSYFEVELASEQGLAATSLFAFGAARPSELDQTWTPAPDVAGPDACEPMFARGVRGPVFTEQFETRIAQGSRPGAGASEPDHTLWVRHKDDAAEGAIALVALADMPPPAVLPMASNFAPISSMTWMFNILPDEPRSPDGWWLLQTTADYASSGYSSQDMLVWNSNRELIMVGRQNVAIFF